MLIGIAAVVGFTAHVSSAQQIIPLEGETAAGDRFGSSVATDGRHILVGSPYADDFESLSGGVSSFARDSTGWQRGPRLAAAEVTAYDQFGWDVAVDTPYAVVGAYGDDDAGNNAGAAYVYEWQDTLWMERAKLTVPGAGENDQFGYSVDISDTLILVGAPGMSARDTLNNSGGAYIFARDTSGWHRDTLLVPDDAAPGDHFGHAVAIDNNHAVVGARGHDTPETDDSGAAYVFERAELQWSQQASLLSPEPTDEDYFGFSVDISGPRILVGAWADDQAATDAGAVHSYARSSGGWNHAQKITAEDATADDRFGYAVALDSTKAIVGAVWSDQAGDGSGAAYRYEYQDDTWNFQSQPSPDSLEAGDEYGYAVAMDFQNGAIIGARGHDRPAENAGFAWVYGSIPQTPVERETNNLPTHIALHPNYPNPFNPTTTITYEVDVRARVRLEIYNVLGRRIETLINRTHAPGRYRVQWDGSDNPSGLYFYRLRANGNVRTRSMLLVK